MRPFRQNKWKLQRFADSHWEMLLSAVGQPLDTAKGVLESCWEKSKGYLRASGQF